MLYEYMLDFKWIIIVNFSHISEHSCQINKMAILYHLVKTKPNKQHGTNSKASACSAGDPGSFPGLGRSLGEGNGNPLQYSCLENSMDWGVW